MSATGHATRERGERLVTATTLGVSTLAWIALALTARTGGHDHGGAGRAGPLAFLGSWLLMVAAMMAPVSVTFLTAVNRLVAARSDRHGLRAIVVIGYAVPWTAVGAAAFGVRQTLDALRGQWRWLADRPWVLTAVVLGAAGAYQLAPLAVRCQQQCRNAAGFVARGWHGLAPWRDMAAIAVSYGWSCIGCCWALMMLMALTGSTSLLLMLLLTGIMVAERRVLGLERMTGTALVCAALLTVAMQAS
jgi:predicted metal-binding membrane protein